MIYSKNMDILILKTAEGVNLHSEHSLSGTKLCTV